MIVTKELTKAKVTEKKDIITTSDLPYMRPLKKGDEQDLKELYLKRKKEA